MLLQLGPGSGRLFDGRTSWNRVAADATTQWNKTALKAVRVRFGTVMNATGTKASGDGRNSVFFAKNVFGRPFGSATLGIAVVRFTGAGTTIETDIVINSRKTFNSYRGRRRAGSNDLRRVIIHEEGHLLGLNHPDGAGQRKTAIMNGSISDLDQPQIDDINGIYSRYGARVCRVRTIRAGRRVNGNITNTDCVAPHRPGTKRADLYTFTGKKGDVVTITMNRGILANPFLVLLGTNGGKLKQNNNGGAGVNARIKLTLPKTGKHTIEATASTNADRGTYMLTLAVG